MSRSSNIKVSPESAADSAQIDELCDAFENEWRRLKTPSIQHYLQQADPVLRGSLLTELLKIDRHWRQQASNRQNARADFERYFPEQLPAFQEVWGAEAPVSPSLVENQTALGPFERLETIGEGGFGVVFQAWDSRHQREVALKIPRFGHQLNSSELDRFLREARAAGSLDHPGIARVWDSGRVGGVTYIAYQFIEGENLKVRFSDIASRPPLEIASFVRQLASAVQFAHDQGIVHRDIKPSNILLTTDGKPVLTDFGLALATSGEATRSLAARVGTLDYMSPEQASGDSAHVDGRADLWSLGVVMYELLTGEKPFQGATDIELLKAVMQEEPRRLDHHSQKIPWDLEVLVSRCLQKRPADRLASCRVLASELQRVELGQPIKSRSVSTIERAYRWCRRNPRPLSAFSMIVLAVAFGAWSWGGRIADNRENQNLVRELQIEVETKNVQRRFLIEQMLTSDLANASLDEVDLEQVETTFVTTDNPAIRLRSAQVLLKHGNLRPPLSIERPNRHKQYLSAIRSLLEMDEEDLKQPLKRRLELILESSLRADLQSETSLP